MKTGTANLPLHPGRAPPWLFQRMVGMARGIADVIVSEWSQEEFLRRISDPCWFQAFSCVLGFDWHSSGTTTVTCGALKEALDGTGIAVAGGKGKASRKTPQEIEKICDDFSIPNAERLVYSSKMAAKVDSAAIQAGYQLYHHVFLLSEKGDWAVVQQGLNNGSGYARRYHWLSDNLNSFVEEPHSGIIGTKHDSVLDMTAKESEECRKTSVDLVKDKAFARIANPQKTLQDWAGTGKTLNMPSKINWKLMGQLYDFQPKNYEELLAFRGVGPSAVRALALVSELVYGQAPSWKDPVRFSFAVGGKDGVPYPVDRKVMDESIEILRTGVEQAKLGNKEKLYALRRLKDFIS